ncbi:MAG: methionyl-tRNA formyltransferase [Spirochaetales bacterium]|jgi:methionyl-tRNA formyltransferase|nr:methionyl-tRNA formyltransferase [Exilispira sp.]NMC68087.1 methionyl-tRNA formyltransferase [Spirochaetales bacterium]
MHSFILFTTSDFGHMAAEYLFDHYEVKAVVTSTPKPKGRHFKLEDINTVKKAKEKDIPIIYIEKSSQIYEKIKDIKVDYFLVVDFAFILKKNVLDLPLKYPINIHPSILPKYRGPSPLHFQIIDNVKKTGISLIKMNEFVDSGDILFQLTFELDEWYTFSKFYDLMQYYTSFAFEIFVKNIELFYPQNQDEKMATYTRKIEKKDAFIDFQNEDASIVVGKIKAFEKWPKVKLKIEDDLLVLLDAKIDENINIKSGYLSVKEEGIFIGCKDKTISILKLQKAGKNQQNIMEFLNGYRKRFYEKKIDMEPIL